MGAPALEVWERDLGGGWLEAYYMGSPDVPVLAVEPGLDADRQRLWELVAHGFTLAGEPDRFICLAHRPGNAADVKPEVLGALRLVLWAVEPEWAAAVMDARRVADCPRVVAAFAGVPFEVALALCRPLSVPSRAT